MAGPDLPASEAANLRIVCFKAPSCSLRAPPPSSFSAPTWPRPPAALPTGTSLGLQSGQQRPCRPGGAGRARLCPVFSTSCDFSSFFLLLFPFPVFCHSFPLPPFLLFPFIFFNQIVVLPFILSFSQCLCARNSSKHWGTRQRRTFILVEEDCFQSFLPPPTVAIHFTSLSSKHRHILMHIHEAETRFTKRYLPCRLSASPKMTRKPAIKQS